MAEKKNAVEEVVIVERDSEIAETLISFYNHRTLCDISMAKRNQDTVFKALDKANGNIALLKEHIKTWLTTNEIDDFEDDLERFKSCFTEFTPEIPLNKETFTLTDSLSLISHAVADTVKATCLEQVEAEVRDTLQDEIRNFINDTYGPIERKVITVIDGIKKPATNFVHEQFDTVLKFVANNEPVYLVGPAGSGKNVICKQVAEALGLKFYFTNAVTQEYKLTGFTDAMGNYQETQFYKAFTEGGLFMLDEMDASIPEVLIILNAAISNKYFDFPAPIGYREAHPDFRIVAAGNTAGHGADYTYVGRTQQDGANLDRFAQVEIDYCEEIENGLAEDPSLAEFCREFRRASAKVGINIIVSYRAIGRLAKMLHIMTREDALKTCLVKGLEKDDLSVLLHELTDSPYRAALCTLCDGM